MYNNGSHLHHESHSGLWAERECGYWYGYPRSVSNSGSSIDTTGASRTAYGFSTTGDYNVAIGDSSLLANTTGNSNTALGFQADVSSGNLSNATAIGANALVSQSNSLVLGNNVNVGIGTSSPTERLHVVGNICYTGSSAACSDIRYKKNFTSIQNALASVNQLNGLYYDWKRNEYPDKEFSAERQIGVIAQEVEVIFPEIVLTDKEGYKSVDYSKLTPILIEAIKELSAENAALTEKSNMLESKYNAQQAQIDAQQAQIDELRVMIGGGMND